MKFLIKYCKKYKKEFILGPIFKFTEAVFELIVPIVTAKIVDNGIKNADIPYIWRMGIVLLTLGVVGLISSLLCQYMASVASQGFGTAVRSELFAHINSLSHKEIDMLGTPTLITRITNDINQLQVAVAMSIRLIVRAPILVIGAAIMAMTIDLKISLIFFAAIPFIALILYLVISKSIPIYKRIQKLLDKISLITQENLAGVRVIRSFSNQQREERRFNETATEFNNSSIHVGRITALLNPLTYAVMNIAVIGIVWFGGQRVNTGHLSQGEVIALVNYMNQILLALVVVANLVILFTKSAASAARVEEIFAIKSSVVDNGKVVVSPTTGSPKIQFCDVSFKFNNGEYALNNLNFAINSGETIGIIGGTGSGKSTLINLIPRFYNATKGKVLIDGTEISQFPLKQLRGKIGIVPQRAVLFSGTIKSNMKWRDENATDEEIYSALEIAQGKDFVTELVDKLDSPIMQGGKNFSGGQRQRLTIARALVGNPEILILDDSASALDYATDSKLRTAIKSSTENMTVIIVSQRASSIRHADNIIVLDDGEIVGIGKHKELLINSKIYKEICLSQFSKEEIEKEVAK